MIPKDWQKCLDIAKDQTRDAAIDEDGQARTIRLLKQRHPCVRPRWGCLTSRSS
jgi:hypothetical protein